MKLYQHYLYNSFFTKHCSKFVFVLTHLYIPKFLRQLIFHLFARSFSIDLNELKDPLTSFCSFNAFFTRELDPDCRSINQHPTQLASPVDGTVLEYGDIDDQALLQAKGVSYSLSDLLNSSYIDSFKDSKFMTIYLSPSDCHRIFSHVDGKIVSTYHISGNRLPVREPFISGYKGLYVVNERIVSIIESSFGLVGMVNVGALNVGCLSIQHHPEHLNDSYIMGNNDVINYSAPIPIKKGDWHSTFHLGSTVILLLPHSLAFNEDLAFESTVNYGSAIGIFS